MERLDDFPPYVESLSFSLEAKLLVARADAEAHRLNYGFVGTEHLLLAVLTDRSLCIEGVLEYVDLNRMRQEAEKLNEDDDRGAHPGWLPLTPNAHQVLFELTPRVASGMGSEYAEPSHILIALCRSGASAYVHTLLERAGLDEEEVKAAVERCQLWRDEGEGPDIPFDERARG